MELFKKIVADIDFKKYSLSVKSAPYLISSKLLKEGGKAIFLTHNDATAKEIQRKTETILPSPLKVLYFPTLIEDVYGAIPPHFSNIFERAFALSTILYTNKCALIASPNSLLFKVPKRGFYSKYHFLFEKNLSYSLLDLKIKLWEMGYKKVELVEGLGEYSIRGSLLDIFPPQMDYGLRVEFFGDEIDEIRFFDPLNQRSLSSTEETFIISPLSEVILSEEFIHLLKSELSKCGEFGEIRIDELQRSGKFKTIAVEGRIVDAFYYSLLEFMGLDNINPIGSNIKEFAENIRENLLEAFKESKRPEILSPSNLFVKKELLEDAILIEDKDKVEMIEPLTLHPSMISKNIETLNDFFKKGFRIVFGLKSEGTMHRIKDALLREGITNIFCKEFPQDFRAGFYLTIALNLDSLVFRNEKWVVVSEDDILGKSYSMKVEKVSRKREIFFEGLRDLKVGDYVVHLEHGIGIYRGVETIKRGDFEEDYLHIEYANNDKLLLPMERMDLIQKYKGSEGFKPPIDKLGSLAFKKRKEKVKNSAKDIANELLKIYAKRSTSKSLPLFKDENLEEEFAKFFPYELTTDQKRALNDVFLDLDKDTPMDRIVCGDVGFGKTEIAMRVAFRVVSSKKQVALLCPTTVLALQHYENFLERFSPFGTKIEMLSRFVEKREQREIVKKIKCGEVDIVIGTHRILSKDVEFKNLALLIIDEEQRFGVLHKEKIKKNYPNIHILTLSATPIPRTLQMGLSSILDMSLIETPPKDRLSIETTLSFYDEEVIKSAIKNELNRKGQVFYLYNKVEDIEKKAGKLKEIIGDGKITIAHGQLDEEELEKRMLDFYHYKSDILLTTTIIENGVDIPRANTLIVENAHKFGLSQLYQIRGRIGRSNVPAYAYLFIPRKEEIGNEAFERLRTLEEFTELGSGFRIAAIDLELRGAGNLLGKEQSGNIDSVGFDLYMRLLEEAVLELKGVFQKEPFKTEVLLKEDLFIPRNYIEDDDLRLSVYRELSLSKSKEEVEKVKGDIIDRFGNIPKSVENLFRATKIKLMAERFMIKKIQQSKKNVIIMFEEENLIDPQSLLDFLLKRKGARMDEELKLIVPLNENESSISFLEDFFGNLKINEEI